MDNSTFQTSDQVLAGALWHRFGLEPEVSISEDLMSAYFLFPKSGELLDAERRYLLDDIKVGVRQYEQYMEVLNLKVTILRAQHRMAQP